MSWNKVPNRDTSNADSEGIWNMDDIITKSPWADIRAFGAVGNGLSSSSGDIIAKDAALSYLNALGSGTLYFPAGHYILDDLQVNGPNRISIVGENRGVWNWSSATINNITEVTRIEHKSGETGDLLKYTSPDNAALNAGGSIRIQNLMLIGNATTDRVLFIDMLSKGFDIKNLTIGVHEDATAGNGFEIKDCWQGTIENITIRHGSENGSQGSRSTGRGFWVYNESGDSRGGAINQLVASNINTRFFGRNMMFGARNAEDSIDSEHLNSIIVQGGASEYAEEWGIYLSKGIESINFNGFHVENSGQGVNPAVADYVTGGGLLLANSAINVKIQNSKYNKNSGDNGWASSSGLYEVYIPSGLSGVKNIEFHNMYFSDVENVGFHIDTANSSTNITLKKITFAPQTNAQGKGIEIDTGGGQNLTNFKLDDIIYDHGSNVFATDIDDAKSQANYMEFRRLPEAHTASFTLLSRECNKFITNEGDNNAITVTLPTVATTFIGMKFRFLRIAAFNFDIKPNTGATIENGADTVDDTEVYRGSTSNAYIEIEAISPTTWIVPTETGTWTII